MIYNCVKCGLSKSDSAMGSVLPQCKCDWNSLSLSDYNIKLERMREMLEVQGSHGSWNYDSYMHGMYNGMEFMIAMLEDRVPVYRTEPEVWLCNLQHSAVEVK